MPSAPTSTHDKYVSMGLENLKSPSTITECKIMRINQRGFKYLT